MKEPNTHVDRLKHGTVNTVMLMADEGKGTNVLDRICK